MKRHNNFANSKDARVSRRDFLSDAAATAAAFTIIPRYVLGGTGYTAPSEKLNIAIIGTGGQGIHNIKGLLEHSDVQVMAVCDVSEEADYSRFYYGGTAGRKPALELVDKHYAGKKSTAEYKRDVLAISIFAKC